MRFDGRRREAPLTDLGSFERAGRRFQASSSKDGQRLVPGAGVKPLRAAQERRRRCPSTAVDAPLG